MMLPEWWEIIFIELIGFIILDIYINHKIKWCFWIKEIEDKEFKPRECTRFENIIFYFTVFLFALPHLPYKKLLIEWRYEK